MTDRVIGPGSRVTLHYRLYFPDGTEVDATEPGEPADIALGTGEMAQGLESLMQGLTVGAKQRFEIDAQAGTFGGYDDQAIATLDRELFAQDLKLERDAVVHFETPGGDEMLGVVIELDDSVVTVDFNHPLVGQDCVFEVEIVAVRTADD